MDNEVGVSVNHVVEMKAAGDESLERIEKPVADGLHERKDSDGDELFEEAMDTQDHLHDQGLKTDLDNLPLDHGTKVKMILNSGSVEVDANSSAEQDVEAFQEAIGVPENVGIEEKALAVVIEEKMQDLVGGDPVDEGSVVGREFFDEVPLVAGKPVEEASTGGADEENTGEEFATDESNELVNNGLLHSGKDARMDGPNVNGIGVMEELKNGNEVGDKPDTVLHESENGESGNVNLEGGPVLEESENRDAGEVKEEVHSFCLGAKFSGEIMPQDDTNEELEDKIAKSSPGYQDDKDVVVENSLDGHLSDKGKGDNFADLDPGFLVDRVGEVKNESPISGLAVQDGKVEEVKDTLATLVEEDNRSSELKDIPAVICSEHNGDVGEVVDLSNNLHKSIEEEKAISEIKSSLSVEHSDMEKTETFQVGVPDVGSQDLIVSRAQHATEDIEFRDIQTVVEEPKRIAAANEERKQHDEGNSRREIQPAAHATSVSGRSENHAPRPSRPAGLGHAAPLLEPAPRAVQQPRVNGSVSQMQAQLTEDPANAEAEETDETREKLQMIRVKFLRLAHRLGQTPHNVVVAQVLYRLGLAEQLRGRNGGRAGAFSFDRASAMAEQLEAAGQEPLDFSCTIMVLGKTGVGKSATINSIFDECKFGTDAFELGTKKVQDVMGTVQGIKVRVIDTPGLLSSWSDQRQNEKILHSVKRFIKKTPPDIVLYLDRLDMQSRDFGDMPLLHTITEIFGPSIWFNAIVVLTHAASAPPDGPNGTASSYDAFVTQRSHVVQQAVRQAAGDMRLMNPVSLVENHSACRTNRAGQRVLPNGQVWKPHLLLLSFASKILAEANTLLKLQDSPPGKSFATRSRAPPLPFLLSSLIQSRPELKLPEEQSGEDDTLDDDLDESSDSDNESEYDELPPFKSLTKAQLEKLTKDQRKAYFDELEYREKLFMKKQLKEERKRRKMMKKMAASANDLAGDFGENVEEESGSAASVPVPMPDLALPASFDSDNPTHRYRFLDSSNQWLVRPVLETHGWDHDVGYEGINVERIFVVKDKIPLSFSGQVTKDKKDASLQLEVGSSIKHGQGKAILLGFDMQTVGKDMIYTMRSETKFSNSRKNKATAGLSVTLLGDAVSAGVKLEDKLIVNKRFQCVVTGGAMTGRGDVAYGGSLEATLRDKDYPLGHSLSTLGVSIMDWHGDLAIGGNIQSQVPIGRFTNMIARANLNNKGTGQVSIRLNSSEQWQIVLLGLIPLMRKLLGHHQHNQYGQW